MNIRPLADRIVVKLRSADDDQVTAGGIVLPDAAKKVQQRGIVQVVGPRVSSLSVGDDVYYSIYAGTRVTLEGDELVIMCESDVLAVFPA